VVTRTNGEEVILVLGFVDRLNRRVAIDIPGYNARIVFSDATGKVTVVERKEINIEAKSATVHVSRSVYNEMAKWAGSILNSKRRV
jgi:hypothetical protein